MCACSDSVVQRIPSYRNLPERIFVVADDLTGACDSAAAFVASGHTVRVLLDIAEAGALASDAGNATKVTAITTESRDLAAAQAEIRVAETVSRLLQASRDTLLFKKIDSTARGPFAAEIEAALNASRARLAIVAPALPAFGRTVANGVLSVRDWSGQDAKIVLRDLFADRASRMAVLPVSSETGLHDAMVQAIASGVRILLCDAAEQRDLDRMAAAALRMAQPILWAGSSGLARALAAQMAAQLRSETRAPFFRRAGRTLLFTGTPHAITALQVAHLEEVSRSGLSHSGAHSRAVHRIPARGASPETVLTVFAATLPAALILTGGDTAAFVLRALGAHAIRLAGEVATGIPWGILEGGLADGCTVVTKSGGFGERDALARAFEFCESEFCEPGVSATR